MGSSPKTSRVLLASAQRTENTSTQVFRDTEGIALRFYLNVTDSPGSGGISVVLRGYDPASGNPVELTLGGVPVVAAGTYVYDIDPNYPSLDTFGNIMEVAAKAIPFQWDALVKHADEAAYTYSLSVEVLK
jgi:hypothetical protein